jgi:hypothetical protein
MTTLPHIRGHNATVTEESVRDLSPGSFRHEPEAPKEQVDNALELLRRLGRELDVVALFCVGRDFGGEFTVGAMYALKDIKPTKRT